MTLFTNTETHQNVRA